ncbi:7722_t:CDS:10 [Paraglomus occultum]|uniref:7722_t:CDS:1 n=1 Tax=Paraglomus occultum TaxID=144539 RepID=A0A9N8Z3V1_9GLOM|nr:7722_t:CDS:10 [Paraglomus occultum]
MSVYPLYKEIFPPTSVEHCLCAKFTSPYDTNLILARTSVLEIYRFREEVDVASELAAGENEDMEVQEFGGDEDQKFLFPTLTPASTAPVMTARLELVAKYKLHGNIMSMGVVTTITSAMNGLDSLLLTFEDAKRKQLSLLEYSLATNSIVTVSIHFYEREDFKREFLSNTYAPKVHVDPSNRCAVTNFYGDKLAILPFCQEETLHIDEEETASNRPYAPSFVVDLASIHPEIKNVIDMTFLYDYYEPTLAILFETVQTWPGKLSSKKDTCSLIIVSLDISQKHYPIIYSPKPLPSSSLRLIPIPRPIGGILVIFSNGIIHIDQSSPATGIALNAFASSTTDFPLSYKYSTLGVALEGCQHVVIDSSRVMLFSRDGDMYLVELIQDGRSVQRIEIEKVGASTIPSCACLVSDGYFFLGSSLGESYLIQYGEEGKEEDGENKERKRSLLVRRNTAELDADLYGTDSRTSTIVTSTETENKKTGSGELWFRVCDTLINVGPIVDMTVGEPTYGEDDMNHNVRKDVELVTCSGYGKTGSLCVFHRAIIPRIISSFDLSECNDMWTVRCRKEFIYEGVRFDFGEAGSSMEDSQSETFDKYLFISKNARTMVLMTGEDIQELDNAGFYTEGPTISVGTLFNETRIVQVYANGISLLNADGITTQSIPFSNDSENAVIVSAHIVDPYVLLLCEDGSIKLLKADDTSNEIVFCKLTSDINAEPIISCCVYRDESDLFTLYRDLTQYLPSKPLQPRKKPPVSPQPENHNSPQVTSQKLHDLDDDIDNELYGDDSIVEDIVIDEANNIIEKKEVRGEKGEENGKTEMQVDEEERAGNEEELKEDKKVAEHKVTGMEDETKATFWAVLLRIDGALEIYQLPDFQEVFCFPNFDSLPQVLSDVTSRQNVKASGQSIEVIEILMTSLGENKKSPYLIVRTRLGDILIYSAFRSWTSSDTTPVNYFLSTTPNPTTPTTPTVSYFPTRLALRFSRIHHEYIARDPIHADTEDKPVSNRTYPYNPDEPWPETSNPSPSLQSIMKSIKRRLIPFRNVKGFAGVFVTGARPVWVICGAKRYVRVLPMGGEDGIKAFTQFHNVNCVHGFLYSNIEDVCRMGILPSDFSYDLEWPVKKINLGRSVHGIEYHPDMQVHALLSSVTVSFRLHDDNGEPIVGEYEDPNFPPKTQKFTLELISPVTWETVDRHDFNEDEQGLCIKCVSLQTKSTASGRKAFIAVGTGYFRGEDVGMRGTIYVYEIIEVVPEPDNPQTNHKFKLLCFEDVKGSVSAICDVNGYLLTCVGPKIFIRAFEDNDRLISVAFIDIQIYATCVSPIKDFILLGDIYNSAWFLGFQEEPAKLALLGKDYHKLSVIAANFILDDRVLYFVIADNDKNIHLFQYAPYNLQSFAGQKLVRRGDFHVGAQINTMVRIKRREVVRRDNAGADQMMMTDEESGSFAELCLCGTLDGSIGMVTPIPEKMYKRMQLLHAQMVNGIPHPAGLNPKSFRLLQSKLRLLQNPVKSILDGDLIFEFPSLAQNRQREMTKQIGTSVERVMDDLLTMQIALDHF